VRGGGDSMLKRPNSGVEDSSKTDFDGCKDYESPAE
jgi:hypothetical protein